VRSWLSPLVDGSVEAFRNHSRPPERTPSLFDGEGTSLSAVIRNGSKSARGIP